MKARKYNGNIEQYTNPSIMIDIVSGNRIVMWNATEKTEAEIEAQGFSEVRLPDLIEGKQYSEIKEDAQGFYCELVDIPVIPQPTPYDLFKWDIAENGLAKAFRDKFFDPRIDKYILSRNLQLKDFKTFNWYVLALKQNGIIGDAEYSEVCSLLMEQNIDLNDYL